MTSVNIILPEPMMRFVEEEAERGGFRTVSDYMHFLIREAQVRAAKRELDAKLLEGIESGPATPMTDEDWAELKRRVYERDQAGQNP
jgi:antitoxin ParD1/3/4